MVYIFGCKKPFAFVKRDCIMMFNLFLIEFFGIVRKITVFSFQCICILFKTLVDKCFHPF